MDTAGMTGGAVTVDRVEGSAALRRFIRLQHELMRGDAAFIPPLLIERRAALSPRRNPWFRHGEAAFWIARRNGRDMGRISAQEDRLALEANGERLAHFGLLAGVDDPAVFAALLGEAEAWARARGLGRIRGPFSLSINEQAGLLVDGFHSPPMLMMPHDPPYAAQHLENLGYLKARDLLAYIASTEGRLPEVATRVVERGLPKGVTLRPMRRAQLAEDIAALIGIFNEAWAMNWGFVAFTPEEVTHLAREMKPLLHERLVWFAEVEARPVAFAVCLPNLNEAIRDLEGRLLLLGWARLLWRLKLRGVTTARVPLMGVRPDVAHGLFGRVLPLFLVEKLRREALAMGIQRVEISWVLEDNMPMRRLAEALGAVPYKTYRVYEKALAA